MVIDVAAIRGALDTDCTPEPRKVIKSGLGHGIGEKDPLPSLDAELSQYRVATIPGLNIPPLIGGAIGYVGS